MKQSGLDRLFKPHSIAVIGASCDPQKAGHVVIRHLLAGQFQGPILPVAPRSQAIAGVLAYPDIESLPLSPDLAIVCTRRERVLPLIEELGKKGTGAAIILAAQFSTDERLRLKHLCQQYGIRLLGPNSMGMLLPGQGINASFSPIAATPGQVAFLSQSAAVSTTILDWAKQREIGFSAFISLGDHCDIDFGQLLDQLSRDGTTRAILIYMDKLHDARHFLSAARAASRNKPILILKSGRHDPANGLDNVYDAAIRRAGMLRVRDTHELFATVETLSHSLTLKGERLAILSNGRGLANMAADVLLSRGGKLAMPPLDIGSDADIEAYKSALETLLQGEGADAILLIHAPSLTARGVTLAHELIAFIRQHPRARRFNILTNWAGEYSAQEGRRLFNEAGIPTYRTPESAVTAFMHMVEYRRNQKQLMETPASLHGDRLDVERCQQLLRQALDRQQRVLDTHLAHPILQAAGLSTLSTWIVSDAIEAALTAEQIGYPVAVKLRSPDIAHKSEVHGVMLNLRTSAEVAQAADAILDRVRQHDPGARIEGLLVQRMARRSGGQPGAGALPDHRRPQGRQDPRAGQPGTARYRRPRPGVVPTVRAAVGLPRNPGAGSAPAAGLRRRDGDPGCPPGVDGKGATDVAAGHSSLSHRAGGGRLAQGSEPCAASPDPAGGRTGPQAVRAASLRRRQVQALLRRCRGAGP